MTTMGNRFGVRGLEAASVHSIRDDDVARISDRPIEVPLTESRSAFGSSCHDPEDSQTKFAERHTRITYCETQRVLKFYTPQNKFLAMPLTVTPNKQLLEDFQHYWLSASSLLFQEH